ncbi:hypothetical protein EYF80_047768 [Liparis tanakae]|uniref:Uncharacterized protein n=1 Tax=Liparis tanakae TaxID=230148 RepID=A0A4Z2FM11_9TELE|nr:hypothetical protein EYF80_047768 [Liparis tanakae]
MKATAKIQGFKTKVKKPKGQRTIKVMDLCTTTLCRRDLGSLDYNTGRLGQKSKAGPRAAGDEEAVEAGWLRGVAWGKQPGPIGGPLHQSHGSREEIPAAMAVV